MSLFYHCTLLDDAIFFLPQPQSAFFRLRQDIN